MKGVETETSRVGVDWMGDDPMQDAYEPPRLEALGTVTDVTLGEGGLATDVSEGLSI